MIHSLKENISLLKKYINFLIREALGLLILFSGGIYVLKLIFKKKPYYMVFNYHNFSKYNNYKIKRGNILETGYTKNFEKQLVFFKKHFKSLYPKEFFQCKPSNGLNLLITFDDGYKDNCKIAFPLLKKYQLKSIFFVVSDLIGSSDFLLHDKIRFLTQNSIIDKKYEKILTDINMGKQNYTEEDIKFIEKEFNEYKPSSNLMMSFNDLISISKSKFQIGNHTKSHIPLSFLNFGDQYHEISKCQDFINSNTEINSSQSIAYPNGLFNQHTIQVIEKSNIDYGFTTIPGFNNLTTNPFSLKRIGINVSDSIGTIILKIFFASLK